MSPQRRASQSPGGPDPGRPGEGSPATDVPPPNALFAEMLRAARELLAVRSPLDAELMVSELLGTWWGQRSSRTGVRRAATGGQGCRVVPPGQPCAHQVPSSSLTMSSASSGLRTASSSRAAT